MKTTCVQVLPGHDIVSKSNTIIKFISLKKSFFCVSCASIGTVFEVFGKKKGWELAVPGKLYFTSFPFAFCVSKNRNFDKIISISKKWALRKETILGLVWTKTFCFPKGCSIFPTSKRLYGFPRQNEIPFFGKILILSFTMKIV